MREQSNTDWLLREREREREREVDSLLRSKPRGIHRVKQKQNQFENTRPVSKHANANNKQTLYTEEDLCSTLNQAVERERATTEDDGQPEVKVDKSQHL